MREPAKFLAALKRHLNRRRRERHGAGAVRDGGTRGHRDGALLWALRTESEAQAIPGDDLDAGLVRADEDEKVTDKGILAEGIPDHVRQGSAALAQVGGLASGEDAMGAAEVSTAKASRAAITVCSSTKSLPGLMRTATPREKRISTTELADAGGGAAPRAEGHI